MEIEELLVAIGVDTTQAAKIKDVVVALGAAATQIATEANKINSNLTDIGDDASKSINDAANNADSVGSKMSKLKLLAIGVGAVIGAVSAKILGFIDSSLAGAKELAKEKGLLFNISQDELRQADEYQAAMKKTGLSIDSIKTKIALNLVPQLTNATKGFNDWLSSNKELISNGLTKVIQWGAKVIQMVVNSVKAISLLIERTVGWKVAIIALVAILAVLKRAMLMAFITNPITWVVAGIVGLMLLLDDLMVYLDGGDSLFGEFWGPAIEWVKSVIAWWNRFYSENKAIFDGIADACSRAFNGLMTIFGGFIKYVGNSLKFLVGLFTGDSDMMSDAWQGMTNNITQMWNGFIQYFSAAFDYLLILWGVLGKTVSNVWEGIKKGATRTFGWIKQQSRSFVSGLQSVFKSITDFLFAPFNAVFDLVKKLYDIFTNDSTTWTQKLDKVFVAIKDFLFSPFKAGWELVKSLFGLSDSDAAKFVNNIGNAFDKVTELIKKPFKAAFDWVQDKFGWLVNGIMDGVNELKKLVNSDLPELKSARIAAESIIGLESSSLPYISQASNGTTIFQDMKVENNITSSTPEKVGSVVVDSINRNANKLAYNSSRSALTE